MVVGFAYSIAASICAHRESGKAWMLFFPHWIDARSGVSAATRRHGRLAFGLLFVGLAVFLLDLQ